MRSILFRPCILLLQGVPRLPMPRPGRTVSVQNTLEIEMERRKKLEEQTKARFQVMKEVRKTDHKGRAIGIDLGTTNSCVCYIDHLTKKPKIIPSPTGSWVFPTAVTFDKNHTIRMYGEEARACVRSSASATLCSGKRLIGRGFGELGKVQSDLQKTNILTLNENGKISIEVMGRTYSVLHIIAMFLRFLKIEAEKYLKEPVDQVVVSVPAYFTPQQKVATEDAALCAGFDVLEIIDEPSATCLAHTVLANMLEKDNMARKEKSFWGRSRSPVVRSFVFDLGGGTLDCAVMEHNVRAGTFRLVATHGDPILGGNDWDAIIADYFARKFEEKWKIPIEEEEGNIGQGVAAFRNLLLESEKAKIHFTHSTEPYTGYNRAFHFSTMLREIIPLEATITLETYVDLTRPLRIRCLECVEQLFQHTGVEPEEIDHVLLVGAMTRDPPLRHMLEEYFRKSVAPSEVCPADYAVAIGAGVRAGMLQGDFTELSKRTRFVSGTVQNLRHANIFRRGLSAVRQWLFQENPNAIGQRWRGKAKGLSDEEISNLAKELVEFEAACARRLLLERVEGDANAVMRRLAADSNRKQGMQEKRILQLGEQIKFWQYMVHNFHDHEDELQRTVKELEAALDELDGVAEDGSGAFLTSFGTIDFSKTESLRNGKEVKKREGSASLEAPEGKKRAEGKASSSSSSVPPPPLSSSSSSSSLNSPTDGSEKIQKTDAGEEEKRKEVETPEPTGPKILRRKAPLPACSVEGHELLEAGHPALLNSDVPVHETTRRFFMEAQVNERAWREPPTPPGEQGSWAEVKKAIDEGTAVGAPLPLEELERPMTMREMYDALQRHCPVDDPASEEHAIMRDHALSMRTMRVISAPPMDMIAVQLALDDGTAEQETVTEDVSQKVPASDMEAEAGGEKVRVMEG